MPPNCVPWTAAEEQLLWEKLSNKELSQRLNRTVRAIEHRRQKLGIKEAMYRDEAKPWTAADDRVVRLPLTSREVADRIGRTLNAVKYRRLRLGVKLRRR